MTTKTTTAVKTAKVIATLFVAFGLMFTSCKKGDTGPKGDKGDAGPQAKTFNFNLTFNSGDTFKSYSGITGFDTDDVVMVYVKYETLGSTDYWSPLPVIINNLVNFIPEFSDQTGHLFINTLNANGTSGSPWTSTATFAFKAVLIKSSQRIANPNVNYNDYNAVKKAFDLKD
jgi:hypothetical protein